LALFSHVPGPPTAGQNLLGPIGDRLAGELDRALGSTVYLLLAIWFLVVILLFLRKSWFTWSCRLVGWLLLFPCVALAADALSGELVGQHLHISGGMLGAWLQRVMNDSLTTLGKLTFFGGALILGLLLALDFVVL